MNSFEAGSRGYHNISSTKYTSIHEPEQRKSSSKSESEWEKNAIRICGNWSEQLSSKGKIYFYNSITEVSQWQKPSDWTLPVLTRHELSRIIEERNASSLENGVKRHLSTNNDFDHQPKRSKFANGQAALVSREKDMNTKSSTLKQVIEALKPLVVHPRISPPPQSVNKSPPPNIGYKNSGSDMRRNSSLSEDFSRLPPPPPPMPQILSTKKLLAPRTNNLVGVKRSYSPLARNPEKSGRPTFASTIDSLNDFIKLLTRIQGNTMVSRRDYDIEDQPLSRTNRSAENDRYLPNRKISPHRTTTNVDSSICMSYKDHRLQLQQGHTSKSESSQDSAIDRQESYNEMPDDRCTNGIKTNFQTSPATITNSVSENIQSETRRNSDPRMRRMSSNADTSNSNPENAKQIQLDARLANLQITLETPEILQYVVPELANRYRDTQAEALERESKIELKDFDRLQSMLYSDLVCELKKLRALVSFSEIKLCCHYKKDASINEIIDMFDSNRPGTSFSFNDQVL